MKGWGWGTRASFFLLPFLFPIVAAADPAPHCPAGLAVSSPFREADGPDGDAVTLRRYRGEFAPPAYATSAWKRTNRDSVRLGLAVDVETTGLEISHDRVWEIGLRLFEFNRYTGEVLAVVEDYLGQQDPKVPFSPGALRVRGGKAPDLTGKKIDWLRVKKLFAASHLVLAHHAAFDRSFIEGEVPETVEKVWACTQTQIDWATKGYSSAKLELLSHYHGFFVSSHVALDDAWALFKIVSSADVSTGKPYLKEVLANARKKSVRISVRIPFERKDLLKNRDYGWRPGPKTWVKVVEEEELATERDWLETAAFAGFSAQAIEQGIEVWPLKINERFREDSAAALRP